MAMSERCGLKDVETLIMPSNPGTKTFIPFGIDGTSVIISAYGEILRMSRYLAEDDPRIICLGSPTLRAYQRDLVGVADMLHELAQTEHNGLHIRLRPASGGEAASKETTLVWINGRWPCINYKIGGLDVSVLFTVDEGILSQRYLITNRSAAQESIQYTLQVGGAQVNTLHVEGRDWAGANKDEWADEYQFHLSHSTDAFHIEETQWEKAPDAVQQNDDTPKITTQAEDATPEAVQHDNDTPKITTRGQAMIALFHNDKIVTPEDAFQSPIRTSVHDSDGEESDDEEKTGKNASSGFSQPLHIVPYGEEKLVVQYSLRRYHEVQDQDSRVILPRDITTLLKHEESGNWSFAQDDDFNPVFRRHLEHILCLCLVNDGPSSEQHHHVPFINDITFRLGSMPINDFYIFRYLLFIYQILDTDDHIHSTPVSSVLQNDSPSFDISALQARIKDACKGHLRWCFEKTFLNSQSWPNPRYKSADATSDKETREEAFVGSLQMLKLFEFARVFQDFKEELSLVNECLVRGSKVWLDVLNAKQDEKSRLWYTETKTEYLEAGLDGGPERLHLPDYRLGDLIYIWKAVKSLEDLVRKSDDETFRLSVLEKLNEYKLRHHEVRKIILHHFLHQPPDARPTQTSVVEESRPDASSFSIAVRRSLNRDRAQFTTKDTMLYDGYEWGFFRSDLDIEVLSNNKETVNANVELSWKNTVKAQGDDYREEIWEKLLRYALAIILANLGSLDSSITLDELRNLSRKRLIDCVLPYGLFAERRDCYTQLPDSLPVSGIERSAWEIPTLLSRQRFENLKLVPVEDAPSSLVSSSAAPTRRDGAVGSEQHVLQLPNDSITREAKIAMKKKVDMKKKTGVSYGKMNVQMVSDPPERKVKDWLYPLPGFIDKRPPYKSVAVEFDQGSNSGLDNRLNKDFILDPHSTLRETVRRILHRGLTKWKDDKPSGGEAFSWGNYDTLVVDVGRHAPDNPSIRWYDADELDGYLRKPRRVDRSRKRFHYLAPLRVEPALILYLATPILDRRYIAQFYVRHSSFSSHFLEYIHDIADVWTTELHLSFLQLVTVQETPGEEVFEGESVCDGRQRRFLHRYKGSLFDIYKASVSCRFIGDMGDKYWSGYLLTYLPGKSKTIESPFNTTNEEMPEPWDNAYRWFWRDIHNDQRNVLEPFLVEKMVVEVYQSTKRILASIDDWLEPETDIKRHEQDSTYSHISKVNDRNSQAQYSRRSNDCPDLEDTLVLLNRLSEANVETLRKWRQREKNRFSPNKPRWSEKDERKHRTRVDSQKRLAERQISLLIDQLGQIQSSLDRIRDLKQELADNLSLFEARRAARQSENIRVFTYATVIFYPLSFVASVFSMQGAPKYDTTIPFIQATAIALIITLLLVFNAGILAWPLGRLSQGFWAQLIRTARPKMEITSNVFPVRWRRTLSRIRNSDGEDVLDESRYTYLMFLVVYWVVEFPALRIVLAYDFVTKNNVTTPKHIGPAIFHVGIAIILLPLFVAIWTILVIYSILHWTATSIETPRKRDTEEQPDKPEQERRKSFVDGDDTKASRGPKNPEGTAEEKTRRERKEQEDRDRKEKGDRVRKQVSLLINPPQLYEDKLRPYNDKIKALTMKKEKRGSGESIRSSSSAPSRPGTPHRSIWSFAKRGAEKAANDKEGV